MSKKIYVGSEKVFDADDYEVAGAVASHAAAADPHPGYLTPAEGNAAYDATGTAAAAVSNHNGSAAAHGLNVAATVGALPMPDAGNYFPGDDTLGTQMQSVGSQLAQIVTEKTSFGVVSGLGVTAQGSPNMTVAVAAGVIWMEAGTRFSPSANNALAVTAADATNPRIDIVYISSAGAISYLAGTPAATPSAPSVPSGGQKIAQILVTAGKTSILTADISDYRKGMWTEAWITPTLLNGWTHGTYPVQYMKDSMGIIHLRGRATSPGSPGNIFSLPTGYRSNSIQYFIGAIGTSATSFSRVDVTTVVTGNVTTGFVELSGIHFKAEA